MITTVSSDENIVGERAVLTTSVTQEGDGTHDFTTAPMEANNQSMIVAEMPMRLPGEDIVSLQSEDQNDQNIKQQTSDCGTDDQPHCNDAMDQTRDSRKHCSPIESDLVKEWDVVADDAKRNRQNYDDQWAIQQHDDSIDQDTTNDTTRADKYCWICHKGGQIFSCSSCPRGYHNACISTPPVNVLSKWVCPECHDSQIAECSTFADSKWASITREQLCQMLLFLIDRLAMQSWAKHFREPVDEMLALGYYTMIVHPVHLRGLRSNVQRGQYASTHEFMSECRWILHNSMVFNGANSAVTSHARLLNSGCSREMALMRACPMCYLFRLPALSLLPATSKLLPPLCGSASSNRPFSSSSSTTTTIDETSLTPTCAIPTESVDAGAVSVDDNFEPWWFSRVCDVIHPVVWVRLKHYPRWPGKVLNMEFDNLLVAFFGDYDVTIAPIGSVKLHTELQHCHLPLVARDNPQVVTTAPTLDPICSPLSSSGTSSTRTSTPPPPPISPGSPYSPPALSMASTSTAGRSRKSGGSEKLALTFPNYRQAMAELDRYVVGLRLRWPRFTLPRSKAREFTKRNIDKYYGLFLYEPVEVLRPYTSIQISPTVAHSATSETRTTSFSDPVITTAEQQESFNSKALDNVPPALITYSSDNHTDDATGQSPQTDVDHPPSRPSSSHTSASYQGVLARVAATFRDLNSVEAMPFVALESLPGMELQTVGCRTDEVGSDAGDSAISAAPSAVLTLIAGDPEASCQADNEPVQQLIERYRLQLNDMFTNLAGALHPSSNPQTTSTATSARPELVDTEVQTVTNESLAPLRNIKRACSSPLADSYQPPLSEKYSRINPTMAAELPSDHVATAATPLQVAMMEEEIYSLDDEVNRLNLLLGFTRFEMGVETRRRVAELRRVWTAEVTAVLDAAIRIWEQDVVRLVDNVKRKQWCAYCGRGAYYYCCWNTCYCNNACQSKHWASHITSCVQVRNRHLQNQQNAGTTVNSNPPVPMGSRLPNCNPNSAPGAMLMGGARAASPTVIRPSSAGGPSCSMTQAQVINGIATDQQSRYHHFQHQQQHHVPNWLQRNVPPGSVVAAGVPLTLLPTPGGGQVDQFQMGGGGLVK